MITIVIVIVILTLMIIPIPDDLSDDVMIIYVFNDKT